MQPSAQAPYFQPTSQAYQSKILINECNAYIGSQLVEVFRNDDEIEVNPNIIIGNLREGIKTIGNVNVNRVIQVSDRRMWNAVIKGSDIIVYSLTRDNAQDFEYLLKYIRKVKHEGTTPQRLICISSMLTWNGRRGSMQVSPALDNLPNRNSSETYLMELENLCLDINNLNLNIQSYVVCAGLVYGYGQGQLFGYFKRALEQSEPLKIYGTGSNSIPMIHLEDLCSIVKDIAFTGSVGGVKRNKIAVPKANYYFAVDNSKTTQQQLIKCIAHNLGNGSVEQVPIQNVFLAQNFDQITVDLTVNQVPTLSNWHMKEGFGANIEKIVSQFNIFRGLKPNKIIVMGPPASGKSKIAEALEKAYGLPVLSVKKVLQQLQTQQNQFANEIKIKLQQIRTQKVQEQRKLFEEAKKKKKGKKDAADQFDPSKIVPRLPEDQMIRVFKNRLSKSDCLNKGYILDGWPKTVKSCEILFTNQKGEINQAIFPNSAFNLIATEEQVKERVKGLPQNIKETTHLNEQATARRFLVHNKANEEGPPKIFLTGKVDIKDVPFSYQGTEQFIEFVERNGPLGFKKKEKPQQKEQEAEKINDNPASKQKQQGEQPENEQQADVESNQRGEEQSSEFDLQKLTEHEKEILNEKSRPIRQYLIDNVIPQITQGLLQICKETPRDPIAFLIKFLENKQAVKNKNRK